jgi:hypothetical protein
MELVILKVQRRGRFLVQGILPTLYTEDSETRIRAADIRLKLQHYRQIIYYRALLNPAVSA